MKTTILFLLLTLNGSAQFLSMPKKGIIKSMKDQKVHCLINDSTLIIPNLNASTYVFQFDKKNICRKEIITTNSDITIMVLTMDLDSYYIKLNDEWFYEQSYGLVKIHKEGNVFTFDYEPYQTK